MKRSKMPRPLENLPPEARIAEHIQHIEHPRETNFEPLFDDCMMVLASQTGIKLGILATAELREEEESRSLAHRSPNDGAEADHGRLLPRNRQQHQASEA